MICTGDSLKIEKLLYEIILSGEELLICDDQALHNCFHGGLIIYYSFKEGIMIFLAIWTC